MGLLSDLIFWFCESKVRPKPGCTLYMAIVSQLDIPWSFTVLFGIIPLSSEVHSTYMQKSM